MELDREKLLKAVQTVEPALAAKELIEECCCIWLDGQKLTAFDSTFGIQVPFKSPFTGGLRGNLVLGLLTHSRAKNVSVEPLEGGGALLKAGRSLVKLSLLPAAQAVYEVPKQPGEGFQPPPAFLDGLGLVLECCNKQLMAPEQLGVTVVPEKKGLALYTTDTSTLTEVFVPEVWPGLKKRVTLPMQFVEQLLKLKDAKVRLFMDGNAISATATDGRLLFSRLVEVPKPTDFGKVMSDTIDKLDYFPVPARLKLALDRAGVLLSLEANATLQLQTLNDQLELDAKTPLGELKDNMRLEHETKQVTCRLNPMLLRRMIDNADEMAVNDKVTALRSDTLRYAIANFQ